MSGTSVTGTLSVTLNDVVYFAGSRTMSNQGDTLNRPLALGQHPTLTTEQFNGLLYSPTVSLGVDNRLLAHWKLNEAFGTIAADSSPTGFHGTYAGGPTLGVTSQSPAYGSAVDFDGMNDQIALGSVAAFQRPNDFTIMAWIKPDSLTGVQRIFSQDGPGGYGFGLNGDEFRFTAYNVQDYNTTGVDLEVGVFQHVAVVFNSDNDALFYVNGELVSTILGVNPANISSLGFFIGSAGGSEYFNGVIDDVRYYTGSLTQAEIAAIIAVPEPTSLMLLGLAGSACLLRRRRNPA